MTDPCTDVVSRREFDRVVEKLGERITHLREMVELQTRLGERALALQAEKYERHFDLLNNEYKRANDERARVVSADTWAAFMENYAAWREGISSFRDNLLGKLAIMGAIWTVLVAAIVALLVRGQ